LQRITGKIFDKENHSHGAFDDMTFRCDPPHHSPPEITRSPVTESPVTERPVDASTAAQSVTRQRILVDTSRLRLLKQPTGIPRVVSKYLEYGHAFARKRGVPLVPIEIKRRGHFQKRRLAGLVPVDRAGIPAKALLEVVRYFVRIAVAVVNLLHVIVPLPNRRRAGSPDSRRSRGAASSTTTSTLALATSCSALGSGTTSTMQSTPI